MSYTFNGTTKRITLSAVTTLNLSDLYSRYKDWILAGNASSPVAFGTVGGEIAAIPLYLFLTNGWRIVPMSSNHTLTVAGGILEVAEGGDPFVDPAGSYAIRINRETPGIAIGYSTSGGSSCSSAGAIAAAVRADQAAELSATTEVWRRLGLDIAAPLTQTADSITSGSIALAITGNPNTSVTVTRQP
jgi:hypothetical protein